MPTSVTRFLASIGVCALAILQAQQGPDTSASESYDFQIGSILRRADENDYNPATQADAIPQLKTAFERGLSSQLLNANVARTLVLLGVKDDKYRLFLLNLANHAMEGLGPYPLIFDANGTSIQGSYAPEFLEWVKRNHLSL